MFNVCYEISNPPGRCFFQSRKRTILSFSLSLSLRLSPLSLSHSLSLSSAVVCQTRKLFINTKSFTCLPSPTSPGVYHITFPDGAADPTRRCIIIIVTINGLAHSFTPTAESAAAAVQLAHDRS